ncbi:MAG TPA: DUF2231 domain-containing protein [Gemmatimonadales bacterium]|nr:DUF2231 domain-containing protein [Gemmatimonadales bacterium]
MFGYDWPRLHAALNDLPAALLIGAVLFDLLAAATRRDGLRVASFWTLMLGALGAAAAVISGLQAEDHIAHGEAVHRLMETHERLALITAGIFGVLALWRLLRENRMSQAERALALALGLGGAGVLTATGVYGGKLVFEHAAGVPSEVLQNELHERAEGHHHHGEGEAHGDADDEHAEEAHEHPAPAATGDPAAATDSGAPAGHVDPPGTPPHSHPADTPPHQH